MFHTLGNAVRNNAVVGASRYMGVSPERVLDFAVGECKLDADRLDTEGARPRYLHTPTVEMLRLKSWDGKSCSHCMPGEEDCAVGEYAD